MAHLGVDFKNKVRSLVRGSSGLDEISVDDLATSTKLQSWEAVEIPERLKFSSRLAIKLVVLFLLIIAFVPWTQTITVTGQLSAYTPYERPQDIEAQITGRIKKWHVFEGVRVRKGDLVLELDDYDPNFMSPDLLRFLEGVVGDERVVQTGVGVAVPADEAAVGGVGEDQLQRVR